MCASFIKKESFRDENLKPSIRKTRQSINETLFMFMVKKLIAVILFFFWASASGANASQFSFQEKEMIKSYLETTRLMLRFAEKKVKNEIEKNKKDLAFEEMPLGGKLLRLNKDWVIKRIEQAFVSRKISAEAFLNSWLYYYKVLFALNALSVAYSFSIQAGHKTQSVLGHFLKLFTEVDELSGNYEYLFEQKVSFLVGLIKLVIEIERSWSAERTKELLDPFFKTVQESLPLCNESYLHDQDHCHRCCALKIFGLVSFGVVDLKSWEDPFEKEPFLVINNTMIWAASALMMLFIVYKIGGFSK
jgi:hypothetical protein